MEMSEDIYIFRTYQWQVYWIVAAYLMKTGLGVCLAIVNTDFILELDGSTSVQ